MKKTGIGIGIVLLSLALVAVFAFGAFGATIHMVVRENNILYSSIYAWCKCGAYGTGSYDTDTSRRLRGCRVRLRQGSYDSGWWSSPIGSESDCGEQLETKKLKRINEPWNTTYTNWDWVYFNYPPEKPNPPVPVPKGTPDNSLGN